MYIPRKELEKIRYEILSRQDDEAKLSNYRVRYIGHKVFNDIDEMCNKYTLSNFFDNNYMPTKSIFRYDDISEEFKEFLNMYVFTKVKEKDSIRFSMDTNNFSNVVEREFDSTLWERIPYGKNFYLEFYSTSVRKRPAQIRVGVYKLADICSIAKDTIFVSIDFRTTTEFGHFFETFIDIHNPDNAYASVDKYYTTTIQLCNVDVQVVGTSARHINENEDGTDRFDIIYATHLMQGILRRYLDVMDSIKDNAYNIPDTDSDNSSKVVVKSERKQLEEILLLEESETLYKEKYERYVDLDKLLKSRVNKKVCYKGGHHKSPIPHDRCGYYRRSRGKGDYDIINGVFTKVEKGTGRFSYVPQTKVRGGTANNNSINRIITIK